MRSDAEFELALRQQLLLVRSAALRDAASEHARALAWLTVAGLVARSG